MHGDVFFLENIGIGDESPLSLYIPESRRQFLECRMSSEGKKSKGKFGLSHRKELMLIAFWDSQLVEKPYVIVMSHCGYFNSILLFTNVHLRDLDLAHGDFKLF